MMSKDRRKNLTVHLNMKLPYLRPGAVTDTAPFTKGMDQDRLTATGAGPTGPKIGSQILFVWVLSPGLISVCSCVFGSSKVRPGGPSSQTSSINQISSQAEALTSPMLGCGPQVWSTGLGHSSFKAGFWFDFGLTDSSIVAVDLKLH